MNANETTAGPAARLSVPTRRLMLLSAAVVAALAGAVLFLAGPAESLNEAACDGDGPDGYQCTELLNKGGDEVIGEQFHRRQGDDGGELEILTHLFNESSTDHSEEKICLDDDTDPLDEEVSCTGGNAGTKIDAGDPLPDPDAGEEDAGEYEVLVQSFDQDGTVTVDGEELAQYVLTIDGYEHSSFHFNQGGFSVESFFTAPLLPDLSVAKTPDNGTIDPGDDAAFTIEVSNAGPGTANDVTLDDNLPGDLTWSESPDTSACDVTNGTSLHCDFGDLAANDTASVTVSAATSSADCGTLDNTATAQAANHDAVSDDGSITVQCGGIAITKTAKHADDSGDTAPNLSAGFTVTDSSGAEVATVTTDDAGEGCADGLALGSYTVEETDVPDGYAAPDAKTVDVDTVGDCDGDTAEVSFANTPLTDLSVSATSQHAGATETLMQCWEGAKSGDPDHSTSVSDGSLDVTDVEPTDPDVTLTCEVTVDP